jgi:hypothetical protein
MLSVMASEGQAGRGGAARAFLPGLLSGFGNPGLALESAH